MPQRVKRANFYHDLWQFLTNLMSIEDRIRSEEVIGKDIVNAVYKIHKVLGAVCLKKFMNPVWLMKSL